jgi:hypothetical protein
LRSQEELRGIGGEASICIAGLGAGSYIEIKTKETQDREFRILRLQSKSG